MIRTLKTHFRQNAPLWLYAPLATLYWLLDPRKANIILVPRWGTLQVIHLDRGIQYRVPRRHDVRRFFPDVIERKYSTYSSNEDVAPEEGDVVIDVGAFVGQFATTVAEIAAEVVAFEPAPRSFACLKYNVREKYNVRCYQRLLIEEKAKVPFNIAIDGSDNSTLTPDSKSIKEKIVLDGDRLDTTLADLGMHEIDFLKIDAEGAELRVLRGATEVEVRKIAVDCSAEHDGETTVQPVASFLRSSGYEVYIDDEIPPEIVFAKLPSS